MKSEQDRPWKHWQPRQWKCKWSRMETMTTTSMEIEIESKNNWNNCNCNGRNQDKGNWNWRESKQCIVSIAMAWFDCDSYQNLNHPRSHSCNGQGHFSKWKCAVLKKLRKFVWNDFQQSTNSDQIHQNSFLVFKNIFQGSIYSDNLVSIRFWPWTSQLLAYPIVQTDSRPTSIPDSKQHLHFVLEETS